MSPIMAETLPYLKENHHLWTIKDVSEALRRVKTNKKNSKTVDKLRAHQEKEIMIVSLVRRQSCLITTPIVLTMVLS